MEKDVCVRGIYHWLSDAIHILTCSYCRVWSFHFAHPNWKSPDFTLHLRVTLLLEISAADPHQPFVISHRTKHCIFTRVRSCRLTCFPHVCIKFVALRSTLFSPYWPLWNAYHVGIWCRMVWQCLFALVLTVLEINELRRTGKSRTTKCLHLSSVAYPAIFTLFLCYRWSGSVLSVVVVILQEGFWL